MEFVTDRSEKDLLEGTSKGCYQAQDLNRVETNTRELAEKIRKMGGTCPDIVSKLDWKLEELFSPETWPVQEQMERYLQNVRTVSAAYGLDPVLPESMDRLTLEGANNIEKALKSLELYIENTEQAFLPCGEAQAGG